MALSIAELNRLPRNQREPLFLQLVPVSLFSRLGIHRNTLTNVHGERVVHGVFPHDMNLSCIEVRARKADHDLAFACQVSFDSFMNSVHLDFILINDPSSERYTIDRDERGQDTLYGLRSRNIPEEIRAMDAGLAPGMVRRGLRLLSEFVASLESFTASVGLKSVTLGALFYHNAISWEREGFTYFRGLKMMQRIDGDFHRGGPLHVLMDDSTPFLRPGMELTVRGRSWAIHDGVLFDAWEEEWENPKMYKIIGRDHHVNTFSPGRS
jgi:hypothetical protein